ncbi:probable receptor-like protein kinase At2g23200 [Rutidosis leptorrhynchoides]|uniref:probable receptor-like protein kinase At2g23200 n=1 Tax=Rutidosis leptorrhynchoides TaxID=125765 RepID=UPI003A994782
MHENIIRLRGYSNETDVKLIVYEHASKGSLDKHLSDASLKWRNRLKICIDVATGLDFIHGGIQGEGAVIHRDIKSANILLFDDWTAKLGDFGLSLISTIDKETNFIIDHPCGTESYVDPVYLSTGILTIESDVYSFGVLLLEILCGREIYKLVKSESKSLLNYIKRKSEQGKQDEIVFEAIKKEIKPELLTAFLDIVQGCLAVDREKRPTSKQVLSQLKKAFEFQNENKM